jgi:hypothetical protein
LEVGGSGACLQIASGGDFARVFVVDEEVTQGINPIVRASAFQSAVPFCNSRHMLN